MYIIISIVFFLLLLFHSSLVAYENENEVICAVTSKIAKFTQKNNTEIKPYTITILHNQFGNLFTKIFKDIHVQNKNVKIEYIDNIQDLKPSNILFLFDTPADELNKILLFTKSKHLLTISTMRGFAKRGGMVQIYSYNQKLKLKINLDKVKQEEIYINSALLRLATIVKGDSHE